MGTIGRNIAGGAAWMVLLRSLDRVIGIISTIILARLLLPADFGVIAMAMSFVAILDLLWTFSFDAALIQNRKAERMHYDTAWTLNICFGATIALGLLVLAHLAAWFYEDSRLVPLISCLAIGSLLQGFENIGVVAFRRELRFGMEFALQISTKIAGFLVTIPLAFALRNYWALAAGMVAMRAAALAISYVAHPFRPRLSLAGRHELLNFSKWLFFNNLLFSVQMRTQDFVIGKVAGPTALGLYNVSYEVSNLPATAIVYPINRAIFPGFARLTEEPGALVKGYLRVTGFIALLILPAGLGIASTAALLVPTVLGDKWLAAIPIVQVLAVYGTLAALSSVFGPTFMALGRPRMLSVFTVLNVVLFVPAVIYGTVTAGVIGAAWGCLAVVGIMMPVSHWIAARTLRIPIREVLSTLWRPFLAATAMFAVVDVFVKSSGAEGSSLATLAPLVVAVGIGILVYVAILVALWAAAGRPAGAEQDVLNEIRARLAARRSQV
jgi:O-antigen/teichoic acid export membrane protein